MGKDSRSNGTAAAAQRVGYLGLRLESTDDGVRATVTWNANVGDRRGDRSIHSLEVGAALRKVEQFVDEYVHAARHP